MRRRALLRSLIGVLAAACGLKGVEPDASPAPEPPSLTPAPSLGRAPASGPPAPAPTRPPNPYGVIDAGTLDRKLLFGYNGFFHAEGDGSAFKTSWHDWSFDDERIPDAANVTVDNWPDLSELDADELFPTALRYPDGRTVSVYSSHTRKTTVRHFRWMAQHGLDGVLLQRFPTSPWDPREHAFREVVTRHVREGCETYGRVFAIEYDIGSMRRRPKDRAPGDADGTANMVPELQDDWRYHVDVLRILESGRYLRHRGRPVLAIYGLGLPRRPGSVAQASELVSWFTRDAPEPYRVTLIGGIQDNWRDPPPPNKDQAWSEVYRSFDVISPWHPGSGWPPGRSARSEADIDVFRANVIVPDVAETRRLGKGYMPVVYPGISWSNRSRNQRLPDHQPAGPLDELNAIPRMAGRFWWRQLYGYMSAGCSMVMGAMFDEMDEGTAMFKLAPTARDAPADPRFVTLDEDGIALPSDWYLRLAGAGTRMLRGEIPLSPEIPIKPS